MALLLTLILTMNAIPSSHLTGDGSFNKCLPEGVQLDEIVAAPLPSRGKPRGQAVTVRETLKRLNARCRNGKLVDGKGKEIYFIRLIGCWGNPPQDYQEQLAKQQQALERLRKKYKVIEISCNQTGDLKQIN